MTRKVYTARPSSTMASTVTKLSPRSDPRVTYEKAVLNGRTYSMEL